MVSLSLSVCVDFQIFIETTKTLINEMSVWGHFSGPVISSSLFQLVMCLAETIERAHESIQQSARAKHSHNEFI